LILSSLMENEKERIFKKELREIMAKAPIAIGKVS
jgi:hypothetical protein